MAGKAQAGRMRRWTVWGWLVACGVGTPLAAAEFPYVAYVTRSDALVRSGPAEQHYPTVKLPTGYAVEVYRHDGGHWCAIRPPAGEYCLAPAEALRLLADQTAEVVAPGTAARIGSKLASSANAVQVILEPGEVVEVLQTPRPGDRWIQIAPPAGEFRWMTAEDLGRRPPVEAAGVGATPLVGAAGSRWRAPGDDPRGAADGTGDRFSHLIDTAVQQVKHQSPIDAETGGDSGGVGTDQLTDQPIEVIPGSPADSRKLPARTSPAESTVSATGANERLQPGDVEAVAIPAAAMTGNQPTAATTRDASAAPRVASPPRVQFPGEEAALPVNQRVAELQLRLSQAVAEPPTAWDLSTLRAETAALLAQEQDREARTQLRDLLDRVAVFEQVQRRYLEPPAALTGTLPTAAQVATGAVGVEVDPPLTGGEAPLFTGETKTVRQRIASDVTQGMIGRVRETTPLPGDVAAPNVAPSEPTREQPISIEDDPFDAGEAKYDAVGTLKPVVSRRANAPRYALVDDEGDIAAFVSAAPDIQLSRYVGRRVGVQGARGFMPDYRRSHVTATRVRTIGETKLR